MKKYVTPEIKKIEYSQPEVLLVSGKGDVETEVGGELQF